MAGALADRLDKRDADHNQSGAHSRFVTLDRACLARADDAFASYSVHLGYGHGGSFHGSQAWQAVVPQLIPRDTLKPAIALNSMGINISRAIGLTIAGILIASVGLASPFAINTISHLIIILALFLWRGADKAQNTSRLYPVRDGDRFAPRQTQPGNARNAGSRIGLSLRLGLLVPFAVNRARG